MLHWFLSRDIWILRKDNLLLVYFSTVIFDIFIAPIKIIKKKKKKKKNGVLIFENYKNVTHISFVKSTFIGAFSHFDSFISGCYEFGLLQNFVVVLFVS